MSAFSRYSMPPIKALGLLADLHMQMHNAQAQLLRGQCVMPLACGTHRGRPLLVAL